MTADTLLPQGFSSPSPPPPQLAADWQNVLHDLREVTLGEYDIGDFIGAGGMAAVFKAYQISLARHVAIKVMRPSLLQPDSGENADVAVARFKQEARTIASIWHPNLVEVYEVRHERGLHFFVMKYVEGRSLGQAIKAEGRLSIPVVQTVIAQVAAALASAHKRGVVHRDVKPPNILLSRDGYAVLTDFGIAKLVADTEQLTRTNHIVGTPSYLSPEQCKGSSLTGASDQYALGVVAYEMLTGAPPFRAEMPAILYAHLEQTPAPIQAIRTDCPPQVEAAVLRMLAKRPEDRFPTVHEAASALGGVASLPEKHPARIELVRLATAASSEVKNSSATPRSPSPIPRSLSISGRRAPSGEREAQSPDLPAWSTVVRQLNKSSRLRGLWLPLAGLVALIGGIVLSLIILDRSVEPTMGPAEQPSIALPPPSESTPTQTHSPDSAIETPRASSPDAGVTRPTQPAEISAPPGLPPPDSAKPDTRAAPAKPRVREATSPVTAAPHEPPSRIVPKAGADSDRAGTSPESSSVAVPSQREDSVADVPTPPERPTDAPSLEVARECIAAIQQGDTITFARLFRPTTKEQRDHLRKFKDLFRHPEWQVRFRVTSPPFVQPSEKAPSVFIMLVEYRDSFGDRHSSLLRFSAEWESGLEQCQTQDRF